MTFIKTISTKNFPTNLTLRSDKSTTSPALAISAEKIANLDPITGSASCAPEVSQKIINDASLQDIDRADQIIGSIDRRSTSATDQLGRPAPSTQIPGTIGGGAFEALDPESFISSHDKTSSLMGVARGSRMEGSAGDSRTSTNSEDDTDEGSIDDYTFDLDEDGNVIGWENDNDGNPIESTRENLGPGAGAGEDEKPGLLESIDGCTTKAEDLFKGAVMATGGGYGGTTGAAAWGVGAVPGAVIGTVGGWLVAEGACALDDIKEWAYKNPNPEDDSAYGGSLKDPFGIVSDTQAKRLSPITKILDPAIDPNPESNTNGAYTGPSLGAITGSNGGTSTGSWNNPYGVGGYSGPSIDAIALSNGGSSTGTFDPLF